ncbi:sensor histidine kinase [Helicobacter pametensis]|uniref:sensor histidine kinase n=1 Tax=Helicobacter pametensis TaxID=95149 RepID=UPI0004BC671F|nr:HAMP domain-containing sensor histidine kinase [Helicobacter pametensis]
MGVYDLLSERFGKMKSAILGTSLHRKTKILLINIAIGLFLIVSTNLIALFGLKYDYDSSFLHQEQKLKQLIVIQNIYSSILADFLNHKSIKEGLKDLREAWGVFVSIQEEENYGSRFKEIYAEIFLDYSKQMKRLMDYESQIATIINQRLAMRPSLSIGEFQEIGFSLNTLLHQAIQLRIEVLNLKKNATNSLFRTSMLLISVLIGLIVLTTLFFSQIIISSIQDLHGSLEEAVFQKTKELHELNDALQQKINQALKESRQKDQVMYQQARLASIGEMIQNIAHQWRQPLNSLILIIQSYKLKYDHQRLSQDFIDSQTQRALRIAKNMSDTIENFRNFFRPHSVRESFSLRKGVEDSLDILQANLKNSNIDVYVSIDERICLFGYENAFTQVVLNLINNAKDAIVAEEISHGVIEVSAMDDQENIFLTIRDNAGGVKIKEIDKIFDPYFTTKHKSVGTGVGLYMVKQIIEKQLEGKISVQNRDWVSKITHKTYRGASFEIFLPYNT